MILRRSGIFRMFQTLCNAHNISVAQYRWPDFRGILSQILGGILFQILTHFARLKILFWFGWLFFGSESSRRDILASCIRTRLVRDIITFNSSRKSRDQSAKSEQQYRVSLRLASYAALTWAASRIWIVTNLDFLETDFFLKHQWRREGGGRHGRGWGTVAEGACSRTFSAGAKFTRGVSWDSGRRENRLTILGQRYPKISRGSPGVCYTSPPGTKILRSQLFCNGMRWYPNSRACHRSRKVSPNVFRTLMRVRCQEKVLRIVCA